MMTRATTQSVGNWEDWGEDELELDRLPGMPMLGFLTSTVLSLALWGVVGLVAWSVAV